MNGELRQHRIPATSYSALAASEFVSHVMTLLSGDVIATGTPSGVGELRPGDCVEVSIEGIGELTNCVK